MRTVFFIGCLVLVPATVLADGCIILEAGVDYLLHEDGTSRVLLESESVCGGAAPAAVPQRMLMGVGT